MCINYRSQQLPRPSSAVHAHHAQYLQETQATQRRGGKDVTLATGWNHGNGSDEYDDVWRHKGVIKGWCPTLLEKPRSLYLDLSVWPSVTFKKVIDSPQTASYLLYLNKTLCQKSWNYPFFPPVFSRRLSSLLGVKKWELTTTTPNWHGSVLLYPTYTDAKGHFRLACHYWQINYLMAWNKVSKTFNKLWILKTILRREE